MPSSRSRRSGSRTSSIKYDGYKNDQWDKDRVIAYSIDYYLTEAWLIVKLKLDARGETPSFSGGDESDAATRDKKIRENIDAYRRSVPAGKLLEKRKKFLRNRINSEKGEASSEGEDLTKQYPAVNPEVTGEGVASTPLYETYDQICRGFNANHDALNAAYRAVNESWFRELEVREKLNSNVLKWGVLLGLFPILCGFMILLGYPAIVAVITGAVVVGTVLLVTNYVLGGIMGVTLVAEATKIWRTISLFRKRQQTEELFTGQKNSFRHGTWPLILEALSRPFAVAGLGLGAVGCITGALGIAGSAAMAAFSLKILLINGFIFPVLAMGLMGVVWGNWFHNPTRKNLTVAIMLSLLACPLGLAAATAPLAIAGTAATGAMAVAAIAMPIALAAVLAAVTGLAWARAYKDGWTAKTLGPAIALTVGTLAFGAVAAVSLLMLFGMITVGFPLIFIPAAGFGLAMVAGGCILAYEHGVHGRLWSGIKNLAQGIRNTIDRSGKKLDAAPELAAGARPASGLDAGASSQRDMLGTLGSRSRSKGFAADDDAVPYESAGAPSRSGMCGILDAIRSAWRSRTHRAPAPPSMDSMDSPPAAGAGLQ